MYLDWLISLTKSFPQYLPKRKNFFEITGFPHWEIVSSNILAFYFDENEEHNFGRLFLDSLLDIFSEKYGINLDFDSEFDILREFYTEKGNRIDILIKDKNNDWAIIIENKIFQSVYNDLGDYWESILVNDKKIGILLTINPENNNFEFYNITHLELINAVLKNLHNNFIDSDDRHLLFLKEYILNIKNLSMKLQIEKENNKILAEFHRYSNEIRAFLNKQKQLEKFIKEKLDAVMSSFGYLSKGRHYYYNGNDKYLSKFRFWLKYDNLLFNNILWGFFELYGKENTIYGEKIRTKIQNILQEPEVSLAKGGKVGGSYFQIYELKIPIVDIEIKGLENSLKQALSNYFFNKNYIVNVKEELIKLLQN